MKPAALVQQLPTWLREPSQVALSHIQQGAFQRSMCLLSLGSSVVSCLEVGYEHYRGSYSNPVMYSPVILSALLSAAGAGGFFSRTAASTALRYTSLLTLVDGLVGFGFHIRGIARKPGGWRMPVVNVVMGPPLFAPLLFGTSAYLGFLGSYLQREEDHPGSSTVELAGAQPAGWREDIRTGRFQKHLCLFTVIGTICVGGESWYSHYKNNFRYRVQWSPIVLTPILAGSAAAAIGSECAANAALPLASLAAIANGIIGTAYHVRGIFRRSGGARKPLYNTLYGPPIFAPMLFAAVGFTGLLAYLMRREQE